MKTTVFRINIPARNSLTSKIPERGQLAVKYSSPIGQLAVTSLSLSNCKQTTKIQFNAPKAQVFIYLRDYVETCKLIGSQPRILHLIVAA